MGLSNSVCMGVQALAGARRHQAAIVHVYLYLREGGDWDGGGRGGETHLWDVG